MRAAWMAARAQLRRRWAATIGLMALVGLSGAVVLASVAGASRTNTSMDRFMAFNRPEDLFVSVNGADGASLEQVVDQRARMLALPQVAEAGRAPYLFLSPDPKGADVGAINPFGAADAHAFRTMDRPRVLHGRLARLDRPDEAIVDGVTANLRHLKVGSTVTMWSFSAEQMQAAATSGFAVIPAPAGPAYTFRIVGIVRQPVTVNPPPAKAIASALYAGQGSMVLTPAFLERFSQDQGVPEEAIPGIEGFRIRLRHGLADLPAFEEGLRKIVSRGDGVVHTGSDNAGAASSARRAIRLEAVALLLFGVVALLASVLLLGQVLFRQVATDAADNATLAALGLERTQLVLVALVRATAVAVGGAVLAVMGAIGLSPFLPIGLAGRAEIHPGLSVNLAVLSVGFVGVAAIVLAGAALQAWRQARIIGPVAAQAPARPGPLAAAVTRSGLGPAAAAGVAMSFERGRGMAFRATLLGAVAAVAGVVGAVTFGVSMRHLVNSPRQQGWNWDVMVGNPNGQTDPGDPDMFVRTIGAQLDANPNVGAYSGVAFLDGVTLDGRPEPVAGIDYLKGSVSPPMVSGRPPAAPNEIALGRDSLHQIHKRIGDTVIVAAGGKQATMRIVGEQLQPTASNLGEKLSSGGSITLAGARPLAPDAPVLEFAVRYKAGVNHESAFRSLRDEVGPQVLGPFPAGDVSNLAQVDSLPYALAGLLVILALGALTLTLLASVRNHRRDLAVLKTIGFLRGQVSATVAWQATILAVGAVVVGIPAGVALGRWTWQVVASSIGSISPPIVPAVVLLLIAPITLLVANLLAMGQGIAAGRVNPAKLLRTE